MSNEKTQAELVIESIERLVETKVEIEPEWMTYDLLSKLTSSFEALRVKLFMKALREGLAKTEKEATDVAARAIAVAIFELGRQVGVELESSRAFREMMGGFDDA